MDDDELTCPSKIKKDKKIKIKTKREQQLGFQRGPPTVVLTRPEHA
jgi:hypothetical protein